MHILAIDPATNTGFARFEFGTSRVVSDVVSFDAELGAFNRQYRRWLTDQIKLYSITDVVIEAAILPTGNTNIITLKKAYAINMNTHDIAKALGCSVTEIQNGSWRAHFLVGRSAPKEQRGKGKLSRWYKQAVKDRCAERGWPIRDDNEADALGLLDYARAQLDPAYAVHSTPLFEGIAS